MRKFISINFQHLNFEIEKLKKLGAKEIYLIGSVAKRTDHSKSDLDLFIVTDNNNIDEKYAFQRPFVDYNGKTYPLHVLTNIFARCNDVYNLHPEAVRIL